MGRAGAVSATSLAAPKKARASFDRAIKELRKGPSARLDRATGDLQKAVDEYPEYAAAGTTLGMVKVQSGDPDGDIGALEKAFDADPRYVYPCEPLVRLYIGKGDWEHATALTRFALGINPSDTNMRWLQAVCNYELGHDDEALALLREIQKDAEGADQFPQTHQVMGLIFARRGLLAEAAVAYNRYLELDPSGPASEGVKKQLDEWGQ